MSLLLLQFDRIRTLHAMPQVSGHSILPFSVVLIVLLANSCQLTGPSNHSQDRGMSSCRMCSPSRERDTSINSTRWLSTIPWYLQTVIEQNVSCLVLQEDEQNREMLKRSHTASLRICKRGSVMKVYVLRTHSTISSGAMVVGASVYLVRLTMRNSRWLQGLVRMITLV